jgi:hypothetical protein
MISRGISCVLGSYEWITVARLEYHIFEQVVKPDRRCKVFMPSLIVGLFSIFCGDM